MQGIHRPPGIYKKSCLSNFLAAFECNGLTVIADIVKSGTMHWRFKQPDKSVLLSTHCSVVTFLCSMPCAWQPGSTMMRLTLCKVWVLHWY